MNVHETLVKARAIQAQGMCKFLLVDNDSNHCMRGSIMVAVSGDTSWDGKRAERYLVESALINANGWDQYRNIIPEMNNLYDTTLDDVLGWFDKAIEATKPAQVVAHDAHTYELRT